MCSHIRRVDAAGLWNRAATASNSDAQIRLLRIFRHLSKWDRLERLLHAVNTSEAVRPVASEELERWNGAFNDSFTTLHAAHRPTLTHLLAQARSFLPVSTVEKIQLVLQP